MSFDSETIGFGPGLIEISDDDELELSEGDINETQEQAVPVLYETALTQAAIDKIIETRTKAIRRQSNSNTSTLGYIDNCFSRYTENKKIDKLNDNIERLLSLLTNDSDYDPPTTSRRRNKTKKK